MANLMFGPSGLLGQTDLMRNIVQGEMPRLAANNPIEQSQPAQPAPTESPQRSTKEALTSFASDLMFTLAHSLNASASLPGQRGTQAGLAAALTGPIVRRTMIQEQQQAAQQQEMEARLKEEENRRAQEEHDQRMEDARQAAREKGQRLVTRVNADGSETLILLTDLEIKYGGGVQVKPPTPQEQEPGFSLSPGQRRFDAEGNEIASVPAQPTQPQGGFSLSPGQRRFDAQGNEIASAPERTPEEGSADPELNAALQTNSDVLSQVSTLINFPDREKFTGSVQGRLPGILSQGRTDFNLEVERLKSLLTLDNLGKMSGVLSDTDIRILSTAATSLDPKMGDEAFLRELVRISEVTNRARQALMESGAAPPGPRTRTLEQIRSIASRVDGLRELTDEELTILENSGN